MFISSPLCESWTMIQVIRFRFMAVRFLLERQVSVCIAGTQKAYDPLYEVDEIEQYITQFAHLCCMYALVIK